MRVPHPPVSRGAPGRGVPRERNDVTLEAQMTVSSISRILAATDLTDASLPALRYARLLAGHLSAQLIVMYADPIVWVGESVVPVSHFGLLLTTPDHQSRLKRELEQHVQTVMRGRPFEMIVEAGNAVAGIVHAATAHRCDLVVMGTHLRHGWRRAVIGSVSEGVLQASACPVLTVAATDDGAGAEPYAITDILCPVNFTEVAREALKVAAAIAVAFNAKLTIVHVVEEGDLTDVKSDEARVRAWVASDVQNLVSYRELVVRGAAAERVLDCADEIGADFLVVGAQHRFFRSATTIGTTTERVIRFAPCPVLVVPRQAGADVRNGARGVMAEAAP